MSLEDVKLIDLPKFLDARGNLSFIEEDKHVSFPINRCYWIYDVPGGEVRGGHSYYENQEVIIALSGSFDVILKKGNESVVITLNRPNIGLLIPKGVWRELHNFSSGSVCLVLASATFDEDDYIRNFDDFLSFKD